MEKISIQELGDVFATRTKLAPKDAERLVRAMFGLIREELAKGNPVKVRGLGTFKIIDVDSRESVNVTTGERIVIEGHEKLTFIPDATMKELVNRPFSQFDTVVLNDGVDFLDVEQDEVENDISSQQEEETAEQQPMVEVPVMEQPEQAVQATDAAADGGVSNEGNGIESVEAEETVANIDSVHNDGVDEKIDENGGEIDEGNGNACDNGNGECHAGNVDLGERPKGENEGMEDEEHQSNEEVTQRKSRFLLKGVFRVLACIVLGCCLVYAGYFYGRNKQDIDKYVCALFCSEPEPVKEAPTIADVAAKPDSSLSKGQEVVNDKAQGMDAHTVEKTDSTDLQPNVDIYAERDARVRTGAYRIVGTDYEVSVKKGETVKRISDRALGPDMECYVEAYNNVTSATPLSEGQKLKIPKLELKKKRK